MASSTAQIRALGATYFSTKPSSLSKKPAGTVFFGQKLNKAPLGINLRKSNRRNAPFRVVAEKVVGIDLGTTNSAVAAMEGGKPTIVTNAKGQRTTPSVVAYTKNGDRLVGQIAKRQAVVNPENTFFSGKRFFGRKMAEVDEESKQVSYNVIRDENGNVKLDCPAIGKQFAAEEISAQTDLSYLKLVEERVVVLVIGGGGREHALCYALQRSPSCDAVFCAPGNAGISSSGDATCISDLDISNSSDVISFCHKWGVGLVVIGPEAPLVAGLSNDLGKVGILAFGPSSEAAALEGSKSFMKNLCDKYGIPTAKYQTFTETLKAKEYIKQQGAPIVIKADGLAAGKGVTVALTLEEAYDAVDSMLIGGVFGSAGSQVVVEEYLEGEEASFFALVDGEHAIPLESAQDHKRVGDGDTGPNTGGMGAYSPAPVLTKELQTEVMGSIILPTVKGMDAEGCKFIGVLYAGLMIEKKTRRPKLIEYNVRFGDPECQVLMVRLESDLVQVLLAACRGELNGVSLDWSAGSAMVVVMASEGYPGKYKKGTVIQKLDEAEQVAPSVKVFHAGTALDADGNFNATGGRVLGVTAKGKDLQEARDKAYQAVEQINWPGGFYRRDIGWRALPQKQYSR